MNLKGILEDRGPWQTMKVTESGILFSRGLYRLETLLKSVTPRVLGVGCDK